MECAERGELLANLRQRYSKLLDKVPRQVKRLVLVTTGLCVKDWVFRGTYGKLWPYFAQKRLDLCAAHA